MCVCVLFVLCRRKSFKLDGHDECTLNSVQHVKIKSEKSITACMHYFPNATELTFSGRFNSTQPLITTILNGILPLKQLTKLVIQCNHFSLKKLVESLCLIPNVHTLVLGSMPFYNGDHALIEQSETFRTVSTTNHIKDLSVSKKCPIKSMKLLLALCPRIQQLSVEAPGNTLEPMVQFLLDKNNPNTRHLYLLCFSSSYYNPTKKLDTNDYTLKPIGQNLYLWW